MGGAVWAFNSAAKLLGLDGGSRCTGASALTSLLSKFMMDDLAVSRGASFRGSSVGISCLGTSCLGASEICTGAGGGAGAMGANIGLLMAPWFTGGSGLFGVLERSSLTFSLLISEELLERPGSRVG